MDGKLIKSTMQNAQYKIKNIKLTHITDMIWSVARTVLLVGLGYILLYPLLNMITKSFSEVIAGDPTMVWIPDQVGLSNFRLGIKALNYFKTMGNTVKISLVSALLQIVVSSIVGYGFARFNFKGKNLLFGLVLFTIIVPPQTIILPLYLSYRFFDGFGLFGIASLFTGKDAILNLLNTPWTFWIPSIFGVGLRGGLFIFIFRQFFMGMPKDMENAAKIDGCGYVKTFLKIMVPNAIPSYLTVFLFSFVWHWNDYALSNIFFQTKNKPLSVYLLEAYGIYSNPFSRIEWATNYDIVNVTNVMCLLTILPILLLYLFAQKYFVESMDRSGIKG